HSPYHAVRCHIAVVPLARDPRDRSNADAIGLQTEPPSHHTVFDVVHRIGDVIGQIHHLSLDTALMLRDPFAQPREYRHIIAIHTEFRSTRALITRPRVFHAGRQSGAR